MTTSAIEPAAAEPELSEDPAARRGLRRRPPGVELANRRHQAPRGGQSGDAEGLADLVVRFARDGALRAGLGRANRDRIASEFSVERMGRATMDLLRGA